VSRLRELRLHGFKTFADPTRFVFERGVNAVIGPNGSGKSNMADAVRWVLGEQSNRSLRTRRADDVIFAGSQQRKPTGLAEVLMTLDNSDGWLPIDFAEVTVGRRAYRSGEAEYLVNGARVRLRDIVELLAGGQLGASSLVIVGQGTVDAALSLRPEERRQLFEEAAGVKNLQVRKNESLGRLARAEENLTRVSDLLGELRPQVRRLALQAEHQQEHDQLGRRARALVYESHRRRDRGLREALGDARRREAAAQAASEALRGELAASRRAMAEAESRYWAAEQSARDAAAAWESMRETVIRLESRGEALDGRAAELQSRLDSARAGLDSLVDTQPARAETSRSVQAAELQSALEAASAAERAWQAAADASAQADAELVAAEEALAAARGLDAERLAVQARLREAEADRQAKEQRLGEELSAVRAELKTAEAAANRARADAEQAHRAADAARASLASARAASESTHREADEARTNATAMAERVAAAQAELEALVERAEQSGAIGERLVASGWRSLVDSVQAPDAAWPAVEAVIGGELSEAVLWRDADPGAATADASGTVRLLDGRRPPEAAERQRGLVAVSARQTLAEWIGGGEGGETPGIFARVAVAPDLDALLAGWRKLPEGWSAVTAEGDLADGRGLVALRGRRDPPGGTASRQLARRRRIGEELEVLEPAYARVADTAATAVAAAAAAERRRGDAQRAADAAEAEARQVAAQAAEADGTVERLAAEEARIAGSLAEMGAEAQQAGETTAAESSKDKGRERASLETRLGRARQDRQAAASAREGARQAWETARQHADELERGIVGAGQQVTGLLARRDSLELAVREAETAMATLAGDRDALQALLRDALAHQEQASARRAEADTQRERLRAELLALERRESGAGGKLAELDRAYQVAAIEVTRHDEALAALAREREVALDALSGDGQDDASLASAAGETAEQELAAEIAALDAETMETELRRIRRLLGQIGSVNPFAVEEHREHAGRLEALSAQESDLRAAIEATRALIARLDSEINERFAVAFAAIGTAFDEFARLLFAGGSASLETVEADDGEAPGGIEIVVRPPGKRPQRLAMLSGGERALTGVALLFAMLSVNPVPFCILDEVDAALDEANIGRFAQALRKLSNGIDFVVITHNRATIEVADTIYGVTMTDAAVSRVVSLRFADLPVEANA